MNFYDAIFYSSDNRLLSIAFYRATISSLIFFNLNIIYNYTLLNIHSFYFLYQLILLFMHPPIIIHHQKTLLILFLIISLF